MTETGNYYRLRPELVIAMWLLREEKGKCFMPPATTGTTCYVNSMQQLEP